MLDKDLAELYGVKTKALKQAVRRNIKRFPEDFMFQLTFKEESSLRSQIVTLEGKGKHSKYLSMAFTEQGVAMLSSVLKSKRAIDVNIAIMRAFVKMREIMVTDKKFAKKLNRIEEHLAEHDDGRDWIRDDRDVERADRSEDGPEHDRAESHDRSRDQSAQR